ncbi:MAG: thiamine phosphate synthase [Caulobacterales bacterium]|jgi:thiamine-phosphate pyrophosphorylase
MTFRCRLYLITPPRLAVDDFVPALRAALAAGDVASVQLRLKDVGDEAILAAGAKLGPIIQDAGGAFLVNDRPDLAAALSADGVHIGQTDAPYRQARQAVGASGVVGVTCHSSRHLAMQAAEAGADYVAFGAFYPTATKAAPAFAELEMLEWWQALMEIPCVAIGGITVANAEPLVRAGADFLAVSGGVWGHADGPAAAVAGFNALFDRWAT